MQDQWLEQKEREWQASKALEVKAETSRRTSPKLRILFTFKFMKGFPVFKCKNPAIQVLSSFEVIHGFPEIKDRTILFFGPLFQYRPIPYRRSQPVKEPIFSRKVFK